MRGSRGVVRLGFSKSRVRFGPNWPFPSGSNIDPKEVMNHAPELTQYLAAGARRCLSPDLVQCGRRAAHAHRELDTQEHYLVLYSDAYFAAGNGATGVEVWRYSTSGAQLVLDVYPGRLSSHPEQFIRRDQSKTWFVARVQDMGRELLYYPSLPNAAGGGVVDINPTRDVGSGPQKLTLTSEGLFFTADDGTNGRELWFSTGRNARMVKDIFSGTRSSNPSNLVPFGNGILFTARDGNGTELWTSDGTSNGTKRVLDIRSGPKSSTPTWLTLYGENVYFAATDGVAGRELWMTDGSARGTKRVVDLAPGAASSNPTQLTAGFGLAFTAWTAANRRQLYVLGANGPVRYSSFPKGAGDIARVTAGFFDFWFTACTSGEGRELYRTKANPTGVQLVHDLRPGPRGSNPSNLQSLGSEGILFRADDGRTGPELWHSDGKDATLVLDICPGPCGSRPSRLERLGFSNTFLFSAKAEGQGIELWKTAWTPDARSGEALLVQDIDKARPLPEMHVKTGATSTQVSIKDGVPDQPGLMVIGEPGDLTLPFSLNGRLKIDIRKPSILVPFTLDPAGTFNVTYGVSLRGFIAGAQSFSLDGMGGGDMSAMFSCANGAASDSGQIIVGGICLDDESGEYTIHAARSGSILEPMHIAIYARRPGSTTLEKIPETEAVLEDATPHAPPPFNLRNQLQLWSDDLDGKIIEMHYFLESSDEGGAPEVPPDPTRSRVIVSYC